MNVFLSKRVLFLLFIFVSVWVPVAARKNAGKKPANVTVKIASDAEDKNLILYSPAYQLKIADFKGIADSHSAGVAATYSGISMALEGLSKNGVLDLKVTITVYFDRTKSWMKPEGKTERIRAHEQIHFDLTAMKACALAKAIEQEKYTSDNAQQKIKELQMLHTNELNKLQQAYDKETKHGTIPEKQAEWAARVAKELAAIQCM